MIDSPASETVWLLRAVIRRYGREIRRAITEAGYGDISTRGLWVIGGLARHGGTAPPKVLVEELGVTKQAVSQLLEALVALGYVRRDGDPNDRRRQVVSLTTRGEQAAVVVRRACSVVDGEVSQRLGDDADRLSHLLYEIVGNENQPAPVVSGHDAI